MQRRWRILVVCSLASCLGWACADPSSTRRGQVTDDAEDAGAEADVGEADVGEAPDASLDAQGSPGDLPEQHDASAQPDLSADTSDAAPPQDAVQCQEGAQECRLSQLFVCQRGRWQPGECPPDHLCLGETGCQPLVCEPGQATCQDDQSLSICNGQGTDQEVFICPEGTRCQGGLCAQLCEPGQVTCLGDSVHRCRADGMGTELVEACDAQPGQVCRVGECLTTCEAGSLEKQDYIGCHYWGVDTPNQLAVANRFAFVVSNASGDATAHVHVEDGAGQRLVSATVLPGQVAALRMPSRSQNIYAAGVWDQSYRLTSDIPISAYQFNPLQSYERDGQSVASNDASLMLPDRALGTEYYGVSYGQWSSYRDFLSIVSAQGDNLIQIRPGADTAAGPGLPAMQAGQLYEVTLQRGQVLNVMTPEGEGDLTGTHIVSREPVGVYAGVDCARVPVESMFCDHIEEQLLPTRAWGQTYLGAAFARRGLEQDLWRVVASSPQTQITLSPPVAQVPTLGPGEHFTFSTAEDFLLEATAPVTLVQFMSGSQTVQTHPNDGDPSMLLAVPVRQFRQRYIFLVPNTYSRDWVSVVHPRGATVMLNGAPLDLGQAQPVAGTQYMVSRLSVEDGRHEVVADMPVGVSVYGFDHNISYAYPAGLDLERPQ